jgi:hypothetical protein
MRSLFLQARAGEALRLLREQREHDEQEGPETALPSQGPVPGERDSALVHLDAVAESTSQLRSLRAYLQNYADQIDPVTRSDGRLLTAADVLRRLMEGVYQPITFDSEERPAGNDDVEWHDRLDLARTDARAFMDDEAEAKTSDDTAKAKSWDVQI